MEFPYARRGLLIYFIFLTEGQISNLLPATQTVVESTNMKLNLIAFLVVTKVSNKKYIYL